MLTRVQPGSRQVPQATQHQPTQLNNITKRTGGFKCKIPSFTVSIPESDSDSCCVSVLKAKTLAVGERDFLFTQHSPVPTPGTRNFFSELTPDTVSIPVIHKTNTSSHSSGPSRQPSLKGREPTSQVPGVQAEPKPAPGASGRTASPGASDSRLCPHTRVSENVRLGIELSSHPTWGVFAFRTKLIQCRAEF